MTYLFKLARRISGLRSVLVIGVIVGAACSKGDKIDYIGPNPTPITPAVATLRVEPQIIAVQTGQQIQFTATALTATGEPVAVTVDWEATGGSILTDGRFLADATGDFRVTAKVRGHDTVGDSARVSVWQNVTQIVDVLVSPDSSIMEEGDTLQADAILKLADGTLAPGAVVTWTANGGTIDDQGTFTTQTAGSYSLTAETSNGLQASAAVMVRSRQRTASSIEVSPAVSDVVPGQSIAFIANASYTDGSTGTEDVVWSSTGGGISPGGVFTAGNVAGQYVVVARQRKGTLADTASINIATPTVVQISVGPASIVLTPGATQQYGALALLTDNTWRPWPVTWKATSGSINASGVYTAGNTFGTFKVIATAVGVSIADTVPVTVAQPLATLTSLHLNPSSVTMPVGGTRQFSVTADWSDGTHVVPTITWSATGGSVANGLYTAGSTPGTYSVVATSSGGIKATSAVTVTPPTLATLNLSPANTSLLVGQTAQFSVTGVLSDGSATVPTVTWTAPGGTMSAAGVYTAGANAGTFAIIATQQSGTLADTALVTVTVPAPVLTGLVLSPGVMTLAPTAWVDFTVIGTWSDGSTSTPAVTWNATGGTMSGRRYTAGSVAGTYRVIAQEVGGTHADTTAITITAPVTLTGLAISPKPASLKTGNALQYVATALWSNGTTTVPTLTWTANGGTVSSKGLYTAGATPGTYWVHAKQSTGTIADSASVTVSTGTSTAPSLLGISISPKPSSVAPGNTQQFTASAAWSDGSTTLPPLTWTATGGTVTGAGLYVAGTTTGTFRVISAGGGKADTAAVTISTSAAPTLTGIVMTPGSASLLTGASQQFTAAGLYSDGSTGAASVTWSATGGLITSTGLYTGGMTTGAFRVIATLVGGTKSDTAIVTLYVPLPPPTGGLYANEPAGMVWNNVRNFDAKVENSWGDRGDPSFSIVQDGTAPISASNIGQAKYYVGLPSGSGPISVWIDLPAGMRTVYVSYWMKMSPNWLATSQATKVVFFHIGGLTGSARVYSALRGTPNMQGEIDFQGMGTRDSSSTAPLQQQISWNGSVNQNSASSIITRGQWVKWEIVLHANTPGQYDGTADWWLNGVKVGSYSKIGYSGATETGSKNTWQQVNWNPTWGGGGAAITVDQFMWMDTFYVSAKP